MVFVYNDVMEGNGKMYFLRGEKWHAELRLKRIACLSEMARVSYLIRLLASDFGFLLSWAPIQYSNHITNFLLWLFLAILR